MFIRIKDSAMLAGLGLALSLSPNIAAQTDPSMKKTDKMSKADKMDMSTDDKAMAFDKMTDKQKMAALKMSGHDMSTTPEADRPTALSKLTNQDKADAYDKHVAMKGHKK